MVFRPLNSRGLGVLHPGSMNLARLTRWEGRIMSPEKDLAIEVLRGNHGMCLIGEMCGANW